MSMTVTLLERQKSGRRYNVHIDGEFALAINRDLMVERDLHEGDEITPGHLRILRDLEDRDAAYAAALRLLGYRPRSEQELRRRLRLRKMTSRAIEPAIARLRRNGLLNDEAFAKFYVESRQHSTPRSRRLLSYELVSRGVEAEISRTTTADIDDEEAAYTAAEKRARRMASSDFPTFQRRLMSFLGSRGFSYPVIVATITRLRAETEAPAI